MVFPHFAFPCGCFGLLAAVAASAFWIWALVDCAMKEPPTQGTNKVIWILIILFTHFLGALLYVLIRRPDRIRETGR